MRLTSGVFNQILRLCEIHNIPDTHLIGTIIWTIASNWGNINKDTVSAISLCERNLFPGDIEKSDGGAIPKLSESLRTKNLLTKLNTKITQEYRKVLMAKQQSTDDSLLGLV